STAPPSRCEYCCVNSGSCEAAIAPQSATARESVRRNIDNSELEHAPPRAPSSRGRLGARRHGHDIVQGAIRSVEEAAQVASCLPYALLVLDHRNADELIAMLAEADAGRDRDIGMLDEQLGEAERAHRLELVRDRRPGEH